MKNNKIEESCIYHLCLHSICNSLFVLIFQKRKILIIITKLLSFLRITYIETSKKLEILFLMLNIVAAVVMDLYIAFNNITYTENLINSMSWGQT